MARVAIGRLNTRTQMSTYQADTSLAGEEHTLDIDTEGSIPVLLLRG